MRLHRLEAFLYKFRSREGKASAVKSSQVKSSTVHYSTSKYGRGQDRSSQVMSTSSTTLQTAAEPLHGKWLRVVLASPLILARSDSERVAS